MRVEVERDRDGRVPEHLAGDLRVDPAAEHERRRGVSEIVEPELRQVGAAQRRLEPLRDVGATERRADLIRRAGSGPDSAGSTPIRAGRAGCERGAAERAVSELPIAWR